MEKFEDLLILEKAISWINSDKKVALVTVINTWGSSPFQTGSKMIVSDNGNFLGSVSGGCIETHVIEECKKLLKDNILFKKIEFEVLDENAWNVGLACGGKITVYLEIIKIEILKEIIKTKSSKKKFAVLTNLLNSKTEIFVVGSKLSEDFKIYKKEIENFYNLKKNGIIEGTNLFIQNYILPVEVIIVGAVHISQYLVDFLKNLNFIITIIDPRKYFIKKQDFSNVKIINEWPNKILKNLQTETDIALITLTHDPKIDDPALQYALKEKFFYIGALGSKKTHENRCQRLKKVGFTKEEIGRIHSPIGIKLGGKTAPEIALSIVAQLVNERHKLLLKNKN